MKYPKDYIIYQQYAEGYELKKGATVIVYCETGGSSTMAARTLAEAGFKVYNAVGGLKRYRGSLTRNAKNV